MKHNMRYGLMFFLVLVGCDSTARVVKSIQTVGEDAVENIPSSGKKERRKKEQEPGIKPITEVEQAVMQMPFTDAELEEDDLEEIRRKRRMVVELVKKGKKYFETERLDEACNAITRTSRFKKGEIYLFVFNMTGFCFAHGNRSENLWQDFKEKEDEYGAKFVLDFIDLARKNGSGWVSYRYQNASKVSYVELVEKNGVQYVIGAGYYPQSKLHSAINLVKGAVRFFEGAQEQGIQNDTIFSTFSYPRGRFVLGDLYLFALDEMGTLVVQGDRPGLVGTNVMNVQDSKGMFVNREIIKRLNEATSGIWLDYASKGTIKRTYAERVTGKNGKKFYIACGYYPAANREKVVDIVKEGYRHMKKGLEQALKDFSNRNDRIFHYGDIYLIVYDMKGNCVAHGKNQELIGRNFLEEEDQTGERYIEKILRMVEKESTGWVNQKRKNAYEWTYFEKVDVGLEDFIITSGLFPISKAETMELLAKDAAEKLREAQGHEDFVKTYNEFVTRGSNYSIGDLEVFVFEETGICVAYGTQTDFIWRNMMNDKDEAGRPYVKMFINSARRTPARVAYKMNGATALAYIERVDVPNLSFYVGSSYYTYDNLKDEDMPASREMNLPLRDPALSGRSSKARKGK